MKDQPQNIKDRIILAVFNYLETKQDSYKLEAQEQLKIFAKHFNATIKKVAKIELKAAFKQFISNGKGYQVTINKLYYSLSYV